MISFQLYSSKIFMVVLKGYSVRNVIEKVWKKCLSFLEMMKRANISFSSLWYLV